jgi:hypothetical protein
MAAGMTYFPIATNTLGSATSSVTFSSISGSYTDLFIVINSGSTTSGQDIRCRFNSDSGSNYSFTYLTGNGSSASSGRATSQTFMPLDYNGYLSGSIATTTIINCMNYSNSTTYKTILGRFNTAAFGTDAAVGLWRSTSAITSIEFLTSASTFLAGSTFTLYGIAAA